MGWTPMSGRLNTLHYKQSDRVGLLTPTCCIKLRKHRRAVLDAGNAPLLGEQELRGGRHDLAGS